jgi:Integrase core domain.
MTEMQTESHDIYGMFYRWGIDYAGELPPSSSGNRYAFIAIDYFTKWIEVIPVPRADAETTVRLVLLHIIARYGVPAEIVTDNGPSFKGAFETMCKDRCIHHRPITPDVPRSNGLAERCVKTVKYSLKKYVATDKSPHNWDSVGLSNILLGYRCTVQAATGLSPAQILFAQDPAIKADVWISRGKPLDFEDPERCAAELLKRGKLAADLRIQVVENLKLAHARNAARFKALRTGVYHPRFITSWLATLCSHSTLRTRFLAEPSVFSIGMRYSK